MARLVVVGAGAAGLYAAGNALEMGHEVTLVEHMESPGKKLLITGKGRCNLTNDCDGQEFMKNIRRNPRFMYSSIGAHPPSLVMARFEALGVPLKTERGRRVFPESDHANDVLQALLRFSKGAKWVHGRVKALLVEESRCVGVKLDDGGKIEGDAVLVATGGVSYPATGSTGDGYRLAKQAGHTIIEPLPSLVSLVELGNLAKRMMGVSLKNVSLTLLEDDKPVFKEQGEMLFTHFGLSGPLVLSASAYIEDLHKHQYTAHIDLKPALTPEVLDDRLRRDFLAFANREARGCLDKLVPTKMRPVLIELWGVEPGRKVNQITKEERRRLGALLKNIPIMIKDRGDLQHAVITAGGVNVKEVDPKTMASKRLPGLYFAGEVLDVDGYTGGYNLQVAWATAYAAASAL